MRRCVVAVLLAGLALVSAAGGARAPAPSLATLLARHVPIFVLHPAERFAPVRVEGFLADSDLQQRTVTGWETIAGPLPAGGADRRLDQRSCQAIDGLAAAECYAAAEDAHASGPVAYGKAFRTKTRIDLQYWIWYPFDDWSPTIAPGEVWQAHEGDWEAVSVILDASGAPLLAGYSQHMAGKRRQWSRVSKRGLRPVVYVGLGSHANFFAPGAHPFGPRTVDPALIAVLKAYGAAPVDLTGRGETVRPRLVPVSAASPSWMTFAGAWGETGYVHVPGRDPLPAGLGPTGPAFHAQWRSPVRTVLSWPRG